MRVGVFLRHGTEYRAKGDVVDWLGRRGCELGFIVSGKAYNAVTAEELAGLQRWDIVLTYVDSRSEEHCDIDTVINDEEGSSFEAQSRDPLGFDVGRAIEVALVA